MDILKELFEQHFHSQVERVQPLQGELGGSGRSIIRLSGDKISAIGILHGVREENAAFIEFSRHFRRRGLPVPQTGICLCPRALASATLRIKAGSTWDFWGSKLSPGP